MDISYMTYHKILSTVMEPRCLIRYGDDFIEQHRVSLAEVLRWLKGEPRPSILNDFNRWWFATLVANRTVFTQYRMRREGDWFVFTRKGMP